MFITKDGTKKLDMDESDLWLYVKSKGIDGRVARRIVREIFDDDKQFNIEDLDIEIEQKIKR